MLNGIRLFILILFCSVAMHGQDSFMTVGTHPGASAQNTATGKQIATLFPWKGKLYAGYGDYGANTGPINIYAFDPDSQKFMNVWQANTEAIYNFRAYNGRVFAPAIDRKSYTKPGDYTMLDTNGIRGDYNFSGSSSTHVFGVALLNDTVLYMVDSQEERAAVWQSKDNGITWKTIHYDTAISGNSEDFARYYFAGVYRGKLYVQAVDYYGSLHPYSEVWDGMQWERDTSIFGSSTYAFGSRPDTFAGKMVLLSPPSGPNGYSSLLRVFDGEAGSVLNNIWVFDFMIDSNYLYALVDSGFGSIHVKRTPDLINWYTMAKAPYGCRSLAIMNDKMYIGMNDSRIMEYTKSISDIIVKVEDWKEQDPGAIIFPNPCSDMLSIILPWEGETIASAIDCSGRVLSHQKLWSRKGAFNVSFLPSGLYLLKLQSRNKIITVKFYKN